MKKKLKKKKLIAGKVGNAPKAANVRRGGPAKSAAKSVAKPVVKSAAKPVVKTGKGVKPGKTPSVADVAKAAPKAGDKPISRTPGRAAGITPEQAAIHAERLAGARRRAYARLTGPQQETCNRIFGLVRSANEKTLLTWHTLGQVVAEVRNDKSFEKSVLMTISQVVFGHEKGYSQLMAACKFAGVYSVDDLNDLIRQAADNSAELTFSHFKYLITLTGPHEAKRKKLEQKLVTEGMTTKDLQGKARKRVAGPASISPLAGLSQLSGAIEAIMSRKDQLNSLVFAPLDRMDAIDADMTETVTQTIDMLEWQAQFCQETLLRLRGVLSRAESGDPDSDESDSKPVAGEESPGVPAAEDTEVADGAAGDPAADAYNDADDGDDDDDADDGDDADDADDDADDGDDADDDDGGIDDDDVDIVVGSDFEDPEVADAEFGVATAAAGSGDFERNPDR